MRTLILSTLLIFAATNWAVASDGHDDVSRAAHRLENATEQFYKQLKYSGESKHKARDAKQLAKAARRFHRQVEKGRSSHRIRSDYAELSGAYAHVAQVFGGRQVRHHGRHFRSDFGEVERAYHHLNRAVEYAQNRRLPQRGYDQHSRRGGDESRYGRGHRRQDAGLTITLRGVFGS